MRLRWLPLWGRATVEGSCVLSVSFLRQLGALRPHTYYPGQSSWSVRGETVASIGWTIDTRSSPRLTLSYTYTPHGRSPEEVEEHFPLIQTWPHFGGLRWWVLCRCGRRAGQLCKPPGASRFRCRRCYRLAYQSQSETSEWRAYRRAQKLAKRLSPEWMKDMVPADLWDGTALPPKPKWMRWRTYETRARNYRIHADRYRWGAMASLDRLLARVDGRRANKT